MSWVVAATRSFIGRVDLRADESLFIYAPIFAAVAFGVAYVAKVRSPWLETIVLAAPALQIAFLILG